VRYGKGDSLEHIWMRQEARIDFLRCYFLAAAVDDLLQPSSQEEIAVFIQITLIPGAEIAVDKGLGIGLRIVEITQRHILATHDHLAGCADREECLVILRHDRYVWTGGYAH